MATKPSSTQARVFISHSHRDRAVATELQSVLTKRGAETYLDQDKIQVGDVLPERIRQGIEWCNRFLLLWSSNAALSKWVGMEWNTAYELRRKIIPYCLDSTPLPPGLENVVYIDRKDAQVAHVGLLRVVFPGYTPPPTDIFPGRWRVTLNVSNLGTATNDLELRANGQITGTSKLDPGGLPEEILKIFGASDLLNLQFSVSGTWEYEDHTEILTLDTTTHGFGQEFREKVQIRVTSRERDKIQGQDFSGRTYTLRRISSEKPYSETAELKQNTHVDRQHKFFISWPIDSEWIPSNKLSKSQRAELGLSGENPGNGLTFFVCKHDTPSSPHSGMVSVFAYPSNRFSGDIQVLVDSYEKGLKKDNVTVLSSTIERGTGGVILTTRDEKTGGVEINRLLVGDAYSYIIHTRVYPPEEEYAELQAASKMILSSFKILN